MFEDRGVTALLVAVVVLLAGCGAGVDGGSPETATGVPGAGDFPDAETGTLAFYVSDRPAAIDDFASLTVTVTEIGVHSTSGGDVPSGGDGSNETTGDGNEISAGTTENATETSVTATSVTNATTTTGSNETATPDDTEESTEEVPEPSGEDDSETDGDSGWITHTVDNATVDLTELRGANASKIADVRLPAGTYNGVTMTVSNVTGTLTTGETVAVKLPSNTLRLNKGFSLEAARSTSFVYDVTVHEAGGSGTYVLRPVIGESGANVSIRDVDTKKADRPDTAASEDRKNRSEVPVLQAKFIGPVKAGRNATVRASRQDDPVANASVVVNGDFVGATDADGRLVFDVPDADTLSVVVRDGGAEVRIERQPR